MALGGSALTLQVMTEELGLHRAEAFAQAENIASNRVLEKNGFTKWGLAHSHTYLARAWRDEVFWEQILASAHHNFRYGYLVPFHFTFPRATSPIIRRT